MDRNLSRPQPQSVNRNTPMSLIFWINFSWSLLVINAIMTPMLLHYGLSFKDIGFLLASMNISMLASDLPFGILADKIGPRATLRLAGLLKAAGGTIPFLFPNFYGFLATFIFIGLANGMYSGADLKYFAEQTSQDNQGLLFENRALFTQLGIALGGIVGALFVSKFTSYKVPLAINCLTSWIPLLIALFLKEKAPEAAKKETPAKLSFNQNLKTFVRMWKNSEDFQKIFQTRIGLALLIGIPAAFSQTLLHKIKLPLEMFGLVWLLQSLVLIIFLKKSSVILAKFSMSHRVVMLTTPLIAGTAFINIDLLGFLCIPLVLFNEIAKSTANTKLLKEYNEHIPADCVATLNSLASTASGIVLSLALIGTGILINLYGLKLAFQVYVVVGILVSAYLYLNGTAAAGLQTRSTSKSQS